MCVCVCCAQEMGKAPNPDVFLWSAQPRCSETQKMQGIEWGCRDCRKRKERERVSESVCLRVLIVVE